MFWQFVDYLRRKVACALIAANVVEEIKNRSLFVLCLLKQKLSAMLFLRFITMLFFIAGYAYTAAQNNFYFGDSAYHQKVARSKMDNKHKRDSLLTWLLQCPRTATKY